MTTVLYTALAATTLLCGLLALALRHFVLMREACLLERHDLLEERNRIANNLHDVMRVLNAKAGGISKRLYESTEIAEAIEPNAP